ncbi:hypothetical protein EGJ23_09975 [Pseudomonas sp. o96-267]|nr:hypothetical protein EGJ23_09975 [Pseudomonas sp. o96-267]
MVINKKEAAYFLGYMLVRIFFLPGLAFFSALKRVGKADYRIFYFFGFYRLFFVAFKITCNIRSMT